MRYSLAPKLAKIQYIESDELKWPLDSNAQPSLGSDGEGSALMSLSAQGENSGRYGILRFWNGK